MLHGVDGKVVHGRLSCRVCWSGCPGNHRLLDAGKSQIQNDPGYWGAADPAVLVLGMTKGFTQSNMMSGDPRQFDGVAFARFRPRLLQSLQAIGLLEEVRNIGPKLTAAETEYGFASMVRCSLTAYVNGEAGSASGAVIGAMKYPEARQTFETCVKTFLPKLTRRTRLVVLLGNADSYVDFTNAIFARLFPDFAALPQGEGQVFRAGGRYYVHTAHPSGSNGHFGPFIAAGAKDAQGRKCRIVRAAVAKILPSRDPV
jgi:hypothetical protein